MKKVGNHLSRRIHPDPGVLRGMNILNTFKTGGLYPYILPPPFALLEKKSLKALFSTTLT